VVAVQTGMITTSIPHSTILSETRVLGALKVFGPQTIDQLASMVCMHVSELLLLVDRLSRDGRVALRRTPDRDYLVLPLRAT
jgi:DNA-binding MarR family transcriptional regulator